MANFKAAVLFARRDSVYKQYDFLDVYDIERNALNFNSDLPVVAHPPCRAWGELSHLAKPREGEKELAFFAAEQVRKNGGVLEHPKKSKLWAAIGCQAAGVVDAFGGFILPINQGCFGHRAEKKTFLYIVGVAPGQIPVLPISLGEASHVIAQNSKTRKEKKRPEVSKAEREHTPVNLAEWLINLCDVIAARKGGGNGFA